jgi:hypothetical protein
MRAFHFVSGINLCVLPVFCALVLSLAGCDGGVGEAVVVEAASDATATAATGGAAESAADAVTVSAIAGSTDVSLDLDGEMLAAEPFSTALEMSDPVENLIPGLSGAGPDDAVVTELDDKNTGDLRMIAMTVRSIFSAEAVFLDAQNKRLIVNAVETRGAAPTWGFFSLGDKVVSDLQQTKRLEFTGADGSPKVFQARQ